MSWPNAAWVAQLGRAPGRSIETRVCKRSLTGTAASAARSYWEDARALAAAIARGQPPPAVTVPVGFTTFPGELWAAPRKWVEAVYPGVADFNEVDRGGHSRRGKSRRSSRRSCGRRSNPCGSTDADGARLARALRESPGRVA